MQLSQDKRASGLSQANSDRHRIESGPLRIQVPLASRWHYKDHPSTPSCQGGGNLPKPMSLQTDISAPSNHVGTVPLLRTRDPSHIEFLHCIHVLAKMILYFIGSDHSIAHYSSSLILHASSVG